MKTQREIIIDCLRYCRHRLSKHPNAGIHKTGLKCRDLDKTIDEVENYNARFGTMSFAPCKHTKGYFFINLLGKEMYYCPTCEQKFKGKYIRKII